MNQYIESQLIRDEGERLKVYDDANGKPVVKGYTMQGHPTVGVGRNLAGLGITREEARNLLFGDITRVESELKRELPFYQELDEPRQSVLLNMCFNLGIYRLLQFKNTLAAIEAGDYSKAASGMRASLWARQVGARADRLAHIMETGQA